MKKTNKGTLKEAFEILALCPLYWAMSVGSRLGAVRDLAEVLEIGSKTKAA